MNTKNYKTYLFFFTFLLIILTASRFLLDQGVWRILLLFLFPITLCFLIWALTKSSFRKRVYISIGVSVICIIFWYDFSLLNAYIVAPFLSGVIALVSSYYIERKS